MHKSIAIYSKILGCTAGQVRRYIRQNRIPSARLMRSRVGRPSWAISDCSPEAIADLKARTCAERRLPRPVVFHEPAPARMGGETLNGQAVQSVEIPWCPMWRPLKWDATSARHDVITRLALLSQGLSWDDLRKPTTIMVDGRRRVEPALDEKIKAFEEKRLEWLRRWVLRDPTDSFTFEYDKKRRAWTRKSVSPPSEPDRNRLEKLLVDINRANIMQAAAYLALYHRRHSIPITYRTLARVLGISKTSLYRQYGRALIGDALCSSRLAATSATQRTIRTTIELV